MQGRLLGRAAFERLEQEATPEGLLARLAETPYRGALAEAGLLGGAPPPSPATVAALVARALWQDLAACLGRLWSFASGSARQWLQALYLPWEAYNLKTIVRGQRARAPVADILAATLPVGRLDETLLARLAQAATPQAMAEVAERRALPFARALRAGLRALEASDSPAPFEYELDRWALAEALRLTEAGEDDRVLRDHVRRWADKANLLTALRHAEARGQQAAAPGGDREDAAREFLDGGGRFTRRHFAEVSGARGLSQALVRLSESPYRWLSKAEMPGEAPSLPLIERRLDRWLLHAAAAAARTDPLGAGLAFAYGARKMAEVQNLRLLVGSVTRRVPAGLLGAWLLT